MNTLDIPSPPSTKNFWAIYQDLVNAIPSGETVQAFAAGLHWFALEGPDGLGLAMAPPEAHAYVSIAGQVRGMDLREAAALSMSWNWADASLGIAAINAWHNAPERMVTYEKI